MPGITKPTVLDAVHSSCAVVAALHAEHVSIDDASVRAVAAELLAAADDVRASVRGLPLPIRFSSLEQELTLLALYHLLDFGSGYESDLRRQGGRGVRDTLLYGLLGLHLGGSRLDAHKLKSFSMYDLNQVFGVEAKVEVAVMPGVTMSKDGPLAPYAKALLAALQEAGTSLDEAGARSPGELLMGIAGGLHKAGRLTAAAFVDELVDSVPSFRDVVLYDGRTLTLHRRAQNLAADLGAVYGKRDERFAFPDMDQLAADSGASTIAALLAKGVLRPASEDMREALAAAGAGPAAVAEQEPAAGAAGEGSGAGAASGSGSRELPAGPHERALRAAAVVACDRIAAAARELAAAGEAAAEGVAAASVSGSESAAERQGQGQGQHGAEAGAGSGAGAWAGAAPFRAVDVGAYLCFLLEEGQALHGAVVPHATKGITAY